MNRKTLKVDRLLHSILLLAISSCGSDTEQNTPNPTPTCTDKVKNGAETDVDCGGATCGKCLTGKACLVGSDCNNGTCIGNVCSIPSCSDGVKDGSETDVDCGGSCGKCADNKACESTSDCLSGICSSKLCAAGSCTDTIKHGTKQTHTTISHGGQTCSKPLVWFG